MTIIDRLRKSEWCPYFEKLMRNRLIVGSQRYETMENKAHRKHNRYDIVGSIEKRIKLYQKDKNLEHLVDIANLCMIEFVNPSIRGARFVATDDTVPHVEQK